MSDRRNIPQKNRTYIQSFKYAFKGIETVFKEERNMKTHVFLGALTLFLCLFLHLTVHEWTWILLSIFMIWIMEIWNTVIENLVEPTTNHTYHPLAKKAKDMAAAAVLLTAFFSVIVGALILIPKIYELFF